MQFSTRLIAAGLGLVTLSIAAPFAADKRYYEVHEGRNYTVLEHRATGAKMSFVTNSGICETTPGVNQYSGYLSVGTNLNMWFWFFEARNNPTQAPLATWFNGGPGCSSMIGLFQENGPCHFTNGASKPTLNPNSWNNNANMLYIDQPIGTGFSYGSDVVISTATAAPYVWKLLQAFYTAFPQYENRDFGIFTESYGGHYGPSFADYFESQNAKIAAGTLAGGIPVNLVALGINNGWFDPLLQYKAYIDYSASNPYRTLISASQKVSYTNTYNSRCVPAEQQCYSSGTNSACKNANSICSTYIENSLINSADFDVYDIRQPSNDPYPPTSYVAYLQSASVQAAIGAKVKYTECSDQDYNDFSSTGDGSRTFLPALSRVVQSGINVLIWAGDADWICNWMGNLAAAEAITWANQAAFKAKAVADYTVKGVVAGSYKTVGNLGWLRVTGAGHEVPYYQPSLAEQVFGQVMGKRPISPT